MASAGSAGSIARMLKQMGFTTSHLRKREGIRVKDHGSCVYVSADYDYDPESVEVADLLEESLTGKGYRVVRKPGAHGMYVHPKVK